MSGPPPGAGAGAKPSPEQIAMFKEAGIRNLFIADISGGLGPYVMGYVFNLIMLGILLSQVWHWASWTRKEKLLIRVVVWLVTIFSFASTVFCMVWFYQLFVVHYGKFAQFVDNTWFSWLPIMDQVAIASCQIFNLDRAYRLNGNSKLLLAAAIPFMLGSCGMIIARKVAAGSADFNAAIVIRPYMYTYFYCTVVIDAILTVGIAFGLWKSKTGWSHTDALIKRIIVYTVETQLLPTLAAITMSVLYSINNSTFMAFMYIICQGKIPAVMLMAVLNYRLSLQRSKLVNHMSTEALVRRKGQDSKTDNESESQSIAMGDYNAANSDWQLPLGSGGRQPSAV